MISGLCPRQASSHGLLVHSLLSPAVTTVLITQCLQGDFAEQSGTHGPLPHLLHVGYSEAVRSGRGIALMEIGNSTDQPVTYGAFAIRGR